MAEYTADSISTNSTIWHPHGQSEQVTQAFVSALPPQMASDSEEAEAWSQNCELLEVWTYHHLQNRDDVWGQYLPLSARRGGSKSFTAPADEERRYKGALTSGLVERHYEGLDQGHLIGLHAISEQNSSRWLAIDIDQHSENDEDAAPTNFLAALHWCRILSSMGFHPLLLDSNGAGGFHIWVLFCEAIPSWVAFHFAKWLIGNHLELHLLSAPETFPKQPHLSESCRYGNWLRLPGRHHTRDHWTKVWKQSEWLAGAAAIKHLLQHTGDNVNILRDWLNTHRHVIDSQRPSRSKIEATTEHPTPFVSLEGTGHSGTPQGEWSRLSYKTRMFLRGHSQNGPQWNSRIFAAACDMAGNGFSFQVAIDALLRGAGPYNDNERATATRTVESAYSKNRHAASLYAASRPAARSFTVGDIEVMIAPQGSRLPSQERGW